MKKKPVSNPLKTFNDNKAMAYKKAGGTMKNFKKSLPILLNSMNDSNNCKFFLSIS